MNSADRTTVYIGDVAIVDDEARNNHPGHRRRDNVQIHYDGRIAELSSTDPRRHKVVLK